MIRLNSLLGSLPPYWQALFKYWTTLERHSWPWYTEHLVNVTKATWHQDLRPLRFIIGAISLSIGIFFCFPDLMVGFVKGYSERVAFALSEVFPVTVYDGPGYFFLRQWIPEGALGATFIIHGFGLIWRNYAPRNVLAWGRIFGAIGIALYIGYPLAIGFGLGRERGTMYVLTGPQIALFVLAWGCAWCARRVGNGEDRSGA